MSLFEQRTGRDTQVGERRVVSVFEKRTGRHARRGAEGSGDVLPFRSFPLSCPSIDQMPCHIITHASCTYRYKAAATPDGKLLALDAQLFNNGGFRSVSMSAPPITRR